MRKFFEDESGLPSRYWLYVINSNKSGFGWENPAEIGLLDTFHTCPGSSCYVNRISLLQIVIWYPSVALDCIGVGHVSR